ncbi:YjiH family protein [Paenibacillus sp. ACRRX]|uniref:YjiH family protein n=1 Tax=unclassified Paenibacillus TaxID=185978 RepID=UPI001EF6663B|nr:MULTISPECIES: YjiH family protein [unclassified Paenibacillus]MCG7408147.1 YjiH family protein [Paenibacillus sp. ACRRX]MDK8181470.1 YjiH family protein [Paenibacillus sp. UMB4589-SE434]
MTSKNDSTSLQTLPSRLSVSAVLSFLIPSILGLLLFVVPVPWDGEVTVPIAFLAKYIQNLFKGILAPATVLLISLAWLGSLIHLGARSTRLANHRLWSALFNVSPFWFGVRTVGFVFAILTYWKIGPEWIWSADTGGMLLNSLLPGLFVVFMLAGLLLPLLVDFGLLEFAGMLMTKVMRPLFTLPGRSSINCMASWLGDGTIGVMMTSKQYESGHYTQREAAVIGTTFTAVSITFSFIVLSNVHLGHMFLPFYATVTFAGMIAAIIMPRIPPLSRKPNSYEPGAEAITEEIVPPAWTPWRWGLHQAAAKAKSHEGIRSFLKNGGKNILDLWVGVIPVVMAIGTTAVALATYTPIFEWLGKPFLPILNVLGVPEAEAAAQTIMVGFADMFLPTVLASGIESELTRFVVAALSVTQLIYMSEVGGLLLGSKLPVNMKDLILIFILRTLITLPIIIGIAHLLF